MRLTLSLLLLSAWPMLAADWIHWRGPMQTGEAKEPGLPQTFSLDTVGKDGLIWKAPVTGRSSPLLIGKKLFTINAFDPGELTEGERVTCFDADTGKVLWNYNVNVYSAEVVTSRLGWTTLTADPTTGVVYTHTTAGALIALNPEGKVVWQRHLSEEFGRFTGYGGRIVSPIYDSGLVITAIINSSWGDQARGGNRFIAFDAKTGDVVWISEPSQVNKGTYQSTPVIAVIGGQRLVIAGGANGALNAMKVRTGELVWSYTFASGPINPSPVVDGNLVYGAHGEDNPEGGALGRVVCVDASQITNGKPKLVWEYRRANRWGLSHPAIADGRLYVPDDGAELFCFNAKTGKLLWRYRYGTTARGAPLINGNKLYIFDVSAKLEILTLNGDKAPDKDDTEEINFKVPKGGSGFVETHATPIAANGRMYFSTSFETYCIGDPKGTAKTGDYKPMPEETKFDHNAAPAGIQIYPHELHMAPGARTGLNVRYLDANGREVKMPDDAKLELSLPAPALPKGATTQPPSLKATVTQMPGKYSLDLQLDKVPPAQQGTILAKWGQFTSTARIRVVAQIPFAQDFEKIPDGAPPAGWVNTAGKYFVTTMKDGNKVLSKVNTIGAIPVARANAYITSPTSTNYTIQSDLYATEVEGRTPDMGMVANRYTFVMDGKTDPTLKTKSVRIVSWEARPRVNKVVSYEWKKDTWYTAKLMVEQKDKTCVVKAKVWEKSQPEPKEWTVEFEDPSPNREGAAALYGYVSGITNTPGGNIYYDNVKITPNK
ncbi:PQQ-like beta-propeller repeat protein [soil metagenome]